MISGVFSLSSADVYGICNTGLMAVNKRWVIIPKDHFLHFNRGIYIRHHPTTAQHVHSLTPIQYTLDRVLVERLSAAELQKHVLECVLVVSRHQFIGRGLGQQRSITHQSNDVSLG